MTELHLVDRVGLGEAQPVDGGPPVATVEVSQHDDLADLERPRGGDQAVRYVEVLVLIELTRAGWYIDEIHLVPPPGTDRPAPTPMEPAVH